MSPKSQPREKRYFDVQVNGYGGVDFNSDGLDGAALRRACETMRRDGVEAFLATIMTEKLDVMCSRLARLAELRDQDNLVKEMLAGFHIEGPFLNEEKGYRGAHPPDAIRPADVDEMKRLLDAAGGLTRIVTLAPERDAGSAVTKLLAGLGVTVAAGHTNATREELQAAIDAGLSMFTHLGNGAPPLLPRHENIIQRVLSLADRLWISFIADGAHVPMFALGNYLRAAGVERCLITTDAIAPAGLGPGRYTVSRWDLVIGEDLVARSPDGTHLVGSAVSMPQAEKNLREHLGLDDAAIRKLTYENPKKAIGGK